MKKFKFEIALVSVAAAVFLMMFIFFGTFFSINGKPTVEPIGQSEEVSAEEPAEEDVEEEAEEKEWKPQAYSEERYQSVMSSYLEELKEFEDAYEWTFMVTYEDAYVSWKEQDSHNHARVIYIRLLYDLLKRVEEVVPPEGKEADYNQFLKELKQINASVGLIPYRVYGYRRADQEDVDRYYEELYRIRDLLKRTTAFHFL